jgi:hypothetical protein
MLETGENLIDIFGSKNNALVAIDYAMYFATSENKSYLRSKKKEIEEIR